MLLCPNGRADAEIVISATDWPGCVVMTTALFSVVPPICVDPSNKVTVPEGEAGLQKLPISSPTDTVNTKAQLTAAVIRDGSTMTCGVAGVMVKLVVAAVLLG